MILSEREIELLNGMIEVQTRHFETCDLIANRVMAEKQKGWDLERITLLNKFKSMNDSVNGLTDDSRIKWAEWRIADVEKQLKELQSFTFNKCPTCGSDRNEMDELIKAEREIERLNRLLDVSYKDKK